MLRQLYAKAHLRVQTYNMNGFEIFGWLPDLQVFNHRIVNPLLECYHDIVLLYVGGGRILPSLGSNLFYIGSGISG